MDCFPYCEQLESRAVIGAPSGLRGSKGGSAGKDHTAKSVSQQGEHSFSAAMVGATGDFVTPPSRNGMTSLLSQT